MSPFSLCFQFTCPFLTPTHLFFALFLSCFLILSLYFFLLYNYFGNSLLDTILNVYSLSFSPSSPNRFVAHKQWHSRLYGTGSALQRHSLRFKCRLVFAWLYAIQTTQRVRHFRYNIYFLVFHFVKTLIIQF